MKTRARLGGLLRPLLWFLCGVMVWSSLAEAESIADPSRENDFAQQAIQESASDLRFIFDVSGSMRHNDPEKLSVSSLELLAALLPAGVRVGIWTFGEDIDNPLPLSRVDEQWRDKARDLEPALSRYQPFTDIEGAIRQAGGVPGPGQRHIILLTDGMIDLSAPAGSKAEGDRRSRQALLNELAPDLANQNVVIHAIAFSDEADLDLVEQLAQRTGGLAVKAQNPDDLLGVFLTIIDRLFPADQVPLQAGRFTIDPQVKNFSALLFHAPEAPAPILVAPDGSRYTRDDHPQEIRWQQEPRFDLISVPSPQVGEWQLEGEIDAGSRIQVESPLMLHTGELPDTLYLGFPVALSAWFEKDAMPDDMQSSNLTVRVMLEDADGNIQVSSSLSEDGGKFTGILPAPTRPGNARLIVDARAEGLRRQRVLAVNVRSPIGASLDSRQQTVELTAQHPRLDSANTRLQARLQGQALPVTERGEKQWRVELPELDPTYRLPLKLLATVELDGQTREIPLPDVLLNTEGQVGLDAAGLDDKGLATQALEQEPEPPTTEPPGLVQRAGQIWTDRIEPPVERLTRQLGLDPAVFRPWMLVLVLIGLLVLLVMITIGRQSARRQEPPREEPHV
ncbi:vWA domain-containing protein [Pistricoccus aurantiacus]|uniref:vWA domain-containing protein n=1 Tax=Pistricoccus aurantiacus TaxID=1883414 RepID=UPI00363C09CE